MKPQRYHNHNHHPPPHNQVTNTNTIRKTDQRNFQTKQNNNNGL